MTLTNSEAFQLPKPESYMDGAARRFSRNAKRSRQKHGDYWKAILADPRGEILKVMQAEAHDRPHEVAPPFTLILFKRDGSGLFGNQGINTLHIPGTNGPTQDYGGWPAFLVNDYAEFGSGGNSNTDVIHYQDSTYIGSDDGHWTAGKHSVQFGGQITRANFNHFELASASGTFNKLWPHLAQRSARRFHVCPSGRRRVV